MKTSKPFNPSDFDSIITIGEISDNIIEKIKHKDFSEISLANELIGLNYEIISSDYKDFEFKNIKDYYHFEVDKIV